MNNQSKTWDREAIQALLESSDTAVCRAILQLWNRQMPSEQSTHSAIIHNDQGFNAADAPVLSPLARRLSDGRQLSPAEIMLARPRLMKYTRQLLDAIAARQLQQLQHQ